ncbi:MAG: TonB family protein [Terriglobales bacterium]
MALLILSQCLLAQTTPSDQVYKVGSDVSAPRAIHTSEPEFSDEARKEMVQGTVLMGIVVGADGLVRSVEVKRPLCMGLTEKAVEAVKSWRFKPGTKNGEPVAVKINVEVNFRLYDTKGEPGRGCPPSQPTIPANFTVLRSAQGQAQGEPNRTDATATAEAPARLDSSAPGTQLPAGSGQMRRLTELEPSDVPPPTRVVKPTYPEAARVGATGTVEDLQVISGDPMLSPAALEAVKEWTYEPLMLNGKPVEFKTTVTVDFKLAGK